MTARFIEIPLDGKNKEKAVKTQLLCVLALSLAAAATGAAAQDSDTITVKTSVAPYCGELAAAAEPLKVGSLIGSAGFVVDTFSGTTTYSSPGYYCNAPATVTLAVAPLRRTPEILISDPSSFVDRIDYKATVDWGTVDGSAQSTSASPVAIASAGANVADFNVTISDPVVNDTARPVAGEYAGSVTVKVAVN